MANDVYNYIDTTGVIITDASVIQSEVTQEYLDTFGADLNTDSSTPQGMLINIETTSRTAVADNNAALANQINPNLSGGVFLDALLQLTGSQRNLAASSLVDCTITGVAGTILPEGAQISTTDGSILFSLDSQTTIPVSGSIANVQFNSVETGPIAADAGTLTTIVSNILGWETVTNPDAATLGTETQTDAQARTQRLNTLALQGNSLAYNVISNVYALDGVPPSGMTFRENYYSTTQVIDEITMVPHSLYACVGGTATDLQVATAIQNSKAAGCAYNNGLGIPISQVVEEEFSHQEITVLFDRPSIVTVSIAVTVHAGTTVQNVTTSVKNAVLAYANGELNGQPGFAVGESVSPFQIASAIVSQVSGIFIQEIEVGVVSLTLQGVIANGMNTVTGLPYNAPVGDFVGIEAGMIVSDSESKIPSATSVSSIVGSDEIIMSHNATGSGTEILTFTNLTVSYQSTEIPIGVWQQAETVESIITVIPV